MIKFGEVFIGFIPVKLNNHQVAGNVSISIIYFNEIIAGRVVT
jgi:hypothetical protein